MTEVEKIAAGLTEAQRRRLLCLNSVWQAGPELPVSVVEHLATLRASGLVERQFGDMGEPEFSASEDVLTAHLSACWFFRLTPLGLAVRHHLQETPNVR